MKIAEYKRFVVFFFMYLMSYVEYLVLDYGKFLYFHSLFC